MDDIKVGDLVRSFDFPSFRKNDTQPLTGPRAAYVEGIVEEVGVMLEGCPRYKIRATRRVFSGIDLEVEEWQGEHFYPPVNGTPTLFGGVANGVVKVVTNGS